MDKLLVLASASPRRRELMANIGLPFVVDAGDADEHVSGAPGDMVTAIAGRKAHAVLSRHADDVIVAADTLVELDGMALGKPKDREDAARMLRMLSGRWHFVHTGVCTLDASANVEMAEHVVTRVRFSTLDEMTIWRYIDTGEPMDKAGAYAIQGVAGMYVREIQGSFSNVIGLPLSTLRDMLIALGYHL